MLFAFPLYAQDEEGIPPGNLSQQEIAESLPPIIHLPKSAAEATEFSRAVRKLFDEEVKKTGRDASEFMLVIYYNDPAVANSLYVHEAITKLMNKGLRVRVERDTSMDEARQVLDDLEDKTDAIAERVIAHLEERPGEVQVGPKLKVGLKKSFKNILRELKVFLA